MPVSGAGEAADARAARTGRLDPSSRSTAIRDPSAVSSFAHRALVAVGIALALGALLFLTWRLREALLLLFAGLLFGLLLAALTDGLHDHPPLRAVPRGVVLALVVTVLLGALVLLFWLRGPAIAEQVNELRDRLPRAVERLRQQVAASGGLGQRLIDEVPSAGDLLSDKQTVLSQATGVVSGVMGVVTNLFVIVLFGIFVAAQPGSYLDGTLALVSPPRRPRVRQALIEAGEAVRKWLVSKVVRMLFIGAATWLALRGLGVPVAFLLAVLAALLAFIPNFGPIIAAIPAVLLALVQGVSTALWVAALYVAVQFIEGNVLDPILTKKIVSIPPALTFGVQVALGVVVGPVGLAVATPLVAAAVVLVRRLYVEDVLGDPGGHAAPGASHRSTASGDADRGGDPP